MTRSELLERLARLEGMRVAGTYAGPEADLMAHLSAWWTYLSDVDLERIVCMTFTEGGSTPADPVERQQYLAIEAACKIKGT